jgi:nicotinamide riboside kinase
MQKILLTGPESSGKSTLARQLADHFGSPWVPEFARDFLQQLPRAYRQEDLISILQGQLDLERQYARPERPFLFCDTGPEVLYIWSQVKYGSVNPAIAQALVDHSYHFRLLCYPDLTWEPDPLREAPDLAMRQQLFDQYVALFEQQGWPYHLIKGQGEERWEQARKIVQEHAWQQTGD